ncbi:hypothetical protein FEM48_Zijuj03G0159200 [Ziziphus jujuba var. spinosa]|uniref:Uncharacterized protein n=1 Tax=Ziziphus jujuba var. spinosa TaxID=714518 RepID=A0A978VR86_ZIZJJ|nr:hypothetical protein FEM48_Zijuj03G0159200 [Ziziphus jujuba var. spinosa]
MAVTNLMEVAELKVNEYKESRKKEKSKLKNSVVSLTEETRNINSLLKIALVEMESVEKSLSRLNEKIDQKRVAILQIVESGLQRVVFGSGENSLESSETKIAILTQELEKTKTDLDISNRKLNQKEELAAAAQATAEKSLQLADSTAARLREWVEELSKQLEEAESRFRNRYKLRHICWPWGTLKLSTATMNNRVENVKRMLSRCKKDAVKVNSATMHNKLKNSEECKKDAVKLNSATMNNKVKNVRRMLSNRKPWRALKLNTVTINNRVKNVKRMLSKCKKDAVKLSTATMNNTMKNVRRMLSKCKTCSINV